MSVQASKRRLHSTQRASADTDVAPSTIAEIITESPAMTFDISIDSAVITGAVLSSVTVTVAASAALPAASGGRDGNCYLSITVSSDHDRTAIVYHR